MVKNIKLSVVTLGLLAFTLGSSASAALIMQFDSGRGVTVSNNTALVEKWADQATTDGSQDLNGTFSMRPTLVSGATAAGSRR